MLGTGPEGEEAEQVEGDYKNGFPGNSRETAKSFTVSSQITINWELVSPILSGCGSLDVPENIWTTSSIPGQWKVITEYFPP